MANFVYNYGKYVLANGSVNLITSNVALILVANTYAGAVANAASNLVSEIASYEITTGTVSGYARQVLANKTVTEDDANGFSFFNASNVTFSSLGTGNTVGGAVLVVDTGNDATSPLLAFYDITDTPTNGGDITIQWANTVNGGVLKLV